LLREWPPVCSPSAGAFATPWGHSPEFLRRCIRNAIFQALTQHILAISPPAFSAHRFAHICQRLFSLAPVKPPRAVLSGWLWFKNNRYNRDPRAVLLGETTPNADPQSDGRTFRWLEPKLPVREDFTFNGVLQHGDPLVVSIIVLHWENHWSRWNSTSYISCDTFPLQHNTFTFLVL